MSERNDTSRTESSDASRGGAPEPAAQQSPQTTELGQFNSELNAACLAIVEDYRCSKVSMAEASLGIIHALSQAPDASEQQCNGAFTAFFDQLQEHEQLTSNSARRGKRVEQPGTQPPNEDGSDSDDDEESPQQDLQPLSRKRGADDDGDRADAGKRRIDKSLVPFAQSGNTSELGSELQSTLQLKENYTRNLDTAKQLAISNPDVPEFPQALWKDVLANNFVDLDKVLSGEYSTSGEPKVVEKLGDTGYSFTAGDLKPSKTIRSHGEWSIAWNSYSDAVAFAYPHRQRELRLYGAEITRLFAATLHDSADKVIQYDRAARSRAAKSNRVLLSDTAQFRDLSISHFTSSVF